MKKTFKLLISILVSELAGAVGSLFTTPSIATWYQNLPKPALNPPNWIFAPVWTTLFAFMGIAFFVVWTKEGVAAKNKKTASWIFAIQLTLNTLWSIIFFGLHNPSAAFIELCVLWLAILATIVVFSKISKAAAWFFLPYILWVSFAGYLNFSIWKLSEINQNYGYPSGIVGEVLIGPNCPAEKIPSKFQCADKPYSTLVAIFRASDPVHAVALLKSDVNGQFKSFLPPGDYIIGAGENNFPHCIQAEVSVTAETFASSTVLCDTGMR